MLPKEGSGEGGEHPRGEGGIPGSSGHKAMNRKCVKAEPEHKKSLTLNPSTSNRSAQRLRAEHSASKHT